MTEEQSSLSFPYLSTPFEYRHWWMANAPDGIDYGACWCSCEGETRIAEQTNRRAKDFSFRGEPVRYLPGHGSFRFKPDEAYIVEDRGYATPCFIWQPCPTARYGHIKRGGKNIVAHRYFYEREVGPVPQGYHLHHRCEQKRCVNWEHVAPLTSQAHRRERRDNKLTLEDAREVKRLLAEGREHQEIADMFGVCRPNITMINIGRIWKDA